MEGDLPQPGKEYLQKNPTANILLNGEKLKLFDEDQEQFKLKQRDSTTYLSEWPKPGTLTTSRVWSNRNSYPLLVGMQNGSGTLEDNLMASYKAKHILP